MASEDSISCDRFLRLIPAATVASWRRPLHREVGSLLHQADYCRETGEVASLGGSQWVCFEKRNDAIRQVARRLT